MDESKNPNQTDYQYNIMHSKSVGLGKERGVKGKGERRRNAKWKEKESRLEGIVMRLANQKG